MTHDAKVATISTFNSFEGFALKSSEYIQTETDMPIMYIKKMKELETL